MERNRFASLQRKLADSPSRRAVVRVFAALAAGSAPVALGTTGETEARKRKKCGPCQKKKKGKCRGIKPDGTNCLSDGRCLAGQCLPSSDCRVQPDGTTCDGDGKCFAGACIARPVCGANISSCEVHADCCSGACAFMAGNVCFLSTEGGVCYTNEDCIPNLSCVAYRCRAGT